MTDHLTHREYLSQAKAPKPNKYRNQKVTVDGIRFDSKREAARYSTLLLLERAGEIRNLRRQVRYELHAPDGSKVGMFIADFDYQYCSTGELVTEDVKSPATAGTRAFQHKKRHFEVEYRRKLKVTM